MERRKAITTAAAASLTLLAGAAGIALNSGIVGASDHNVGQISPVKTTNPPVTVYIDDPSAATVTPAPRLQSTDSQPVATSAASSYQDDEHDGDGYEGEPYEHDSGDRYQYQGAEDDD